MFHLNFGKKHTCVNYCRNSECVVHWIGMVLACTWNTWSFSQIARFMGLIWAHLGPTEPRWAPCWPHELSGMNFVRGRISQNYAHGSHLDMFSYDLVLVDFAFTFLRCFTGIMPISWLHYYQRSNPRQCGLDMVCICLNEVCTEIYHLY